MEKAEMAGSTPMEGKKEKRLIVLSSAMFSIAVIFFWMAMPPEIFTRLTHDTAITWLTGEDGSAPLLSRARLAFPLGIVLGGIIAFIMTWLFAYHRYRVTFDLRKENPEGQFYSEDLSDQPIWPEKNSLGKDWEEESLLLEGDEIILKSPDRAFLQQQTGSTFKEETQNSVFVLNDYSEKTVAEANNEPSSQPPEASPSFDAFLEEASFSAKQSVFPAEAEWADNTDIERSQDAASQQAPKILSLSNTVEKQPNSFEKSGEETLFLSSEQILQKPIQDSPNPASAPPIVTIELSQLDRDQALTQALALIKEMREQLTSVRKM
ncbi:hypothetical protein ZMO01_16150 [Zymomonas mobilis subsp. mobilis]|uniref:hypothetical protein n=1 Tax=Zymomonas mobilis TaxID=542 RepID=UPI0002E97262|nr:hypothetical protein [Zymomonas mobilis]GEB88275.1 hypothetical protein ZMO01_16150 [Zymomonas mobilis subsp. mobilis]